MLVTYLKHIFGSQRCMVRPPDASKPPHSFHELNAKLITGESFDFLRLKGKKVLIVNTASNCAYTDQYSLLENFQRIYSNSLVVLGFPCNDFFRQEPESGSKIQEFCALHYDISFPLFEKITIVGEHRSSVFNWLSSKMHNGWNDRSPRWNFCKYLVDEKGELLLFATSAILPTHKELISLVER